MKTSDWFFVQSVVLLKLSLISKGVVLNFGKKMYEGGVLYLVFPVIVVVLSAMFFLYL